MKIRLTTIINIFLFLLLLVITYLVVPILFHSTEIATNDLDVEHSNNSLDYVNNSPLNGLPFTENTYTYRVYDDSELQHIYVTILPSIDEETGDKITFDDLNESITPEDLYAGKIPDVSMEIFFQNGDRNGPLQDIFTPKIDRVNAKIELRGNSSRLYIQKSYKITLSRNTATFNGQKIINLNKHVYDPLRITNKFSYDAFEILPNVGSLNTFFVEVHIKDLSQKSTGEFVDYGLYTMVEQPNKSYLESRGLDSFGSLYKAENFAFRPAEYLLSENDPNYSKEEFEKIIKIRENPNHDKLIDMVNQVSNYSNNINDVVDIYFNRDNYITWMAMNMVLGNSDATSHNYILYSPQNSLTWYFLPWDYDGALYYNYLDYYEYENFPLSKYGLAAYWGIELHNRFFKDPNNIEDLVEKVDEIMNDYITAEYTQEFYDKYIDILRETTFQLPDVKRLSMTAEEMDYRILTIRDILEKNVALFKENLEHPMPIYLNLPKQNDNNSYTFSWQNSYDIQGDKIYYNLEIARDPNFVNIIYKSEDLSATKIDLELDLPVDIYYFRILIRDEFGNTQFPMESFVDPVSGDFYYGGYYFEVLE